MNNLEKITARIVAEAEGAAKAALERAHEECAAIEAEAADRAKSVMASARGAAARAAAAADERAESAADMKQREILLAAKVGILQKTFSEAEEALYALPEEEYVSFLGHLLADAALDRIRTVKRLREEYGEAEEEYSLDFAVALSEKDQPLGQAVITAARKYMRMASAALGKTEFALLTEAAPIRGGLILYYGDAATNCSVEAVVAGVRARLEPEVAKMLFSADE